MIMGVIIRMYIPKNEREKRKENAKYKGYSYRYYIKKKYLGFRFFFNKNNILEKISKNF